MNFLDNVDKDLQALLIEARKKNPETKDVHRKEKIIKKKIILI
jgi:hypothetical protein